LRQPLSKDPNEPPLTHTARTFLPRTPTKILRRTATSFFSNLSPHTAFSHGTTALAPNGAAESGPDMNLLGKTALTLAGSATLLVATGCASHPYYPPPPPPPAYSQRPPLIELADHNGFRFGSDNGARDAYEGRGYRPQRDRAFHDTPGYDPNLGPFEPYRRAFRDAYLRGYDNGFRRQQPPPQ
jgi:hypothetical protein